MPATPEELLRAAADATTHAYAPYSNFSVGSAILSEDGEVTTGCNVENASYGLTMCSERSAIFAAASRGKRKFTAVAIVATGGADSRPYPCGACRQVLAEFCDPDCAIYVASLEDLDDYETFTLGELLPKNFKL